MGTEFISSPFGLGNTDLVGRLPVLGTTVNAENKNVKREAPVTVSYNGFTGELVELKRTHIGDCRYSLSIYDAVKDATYSFAGVKMSDMKFLGGVVSFGAAT